MFLLKKIIRKNSTIRQFVRELKMFFVRKKHGLQKVHRTFYMGGYSNISKDFVAGAYSFVNHGCEICPRVKVGSYVIFGPNVTITGSDHDYKQPGTPIYFSQRPELPHTIIENDVWIGSGSIIMAGVHIGRGSVIAAGSVVTRNIKPYILVGGVPAAFIKNRFNNDIDKRKHDAMLNNSPKRGKYPDPIHFFRE